MNTSRPEMNAMRVKQLQQQYSIGDSHVIYDATGSGRYMSDYIRDSIPFISNTKPFGAESLSHVYLKDECYGRLIWMINNDRISFKAGIGEKRYAHANIKDNTTVRNEFIEECSVVRWKEQSNGKKRLANKKEMNSMLGRGRSMDWLDPMAMRMYPVIECERGEELYYGIEQEEEDYDYLYGRKRSGHGAFDIYNDNNWA